MYRKKYKVGFTPTPIHTQSSGDIGIIAADRLSISQNIKSSRDVGVKPTERVLVSGFTLIELLVVIAIIGVLAAIVLAALDESRKKGRDANRASQIQEFLKAAELYYSDTGGYPNDGTGGNTDPVEISAATGFLRTEGGYLSRIPSDPRFVAVNGYLYCSSDNRDSMTILVHAETSAGDYCLVSRGLSPIGSYCGTLPANSGNCTDRF